MFTARQHYNLAMGSEQSAREKASSEAQADRETALVYAQLANMHATLYLAKMVNRKS